MKELCIEGVATHDDPESCVGVRKGAGEALTGANVGRAIEPRNSPIGSAEAVEHVEGNTAGSARSRAAGGPRAVGEPVHAGNLHAREPGGPIPTPSADHRTGPPRKGQGRTPRMNGHGKSDSLVLPTNPPNKAQAAEAGEGRGLAEGNTIVPTRPGRSAGQDVPSGLDRVREVARRDKDARFTALLHHVDLARLWAAYTAINPKAAPGVDEVTWDAYGQDLRANLEDLLARVHSGAYRAKPTRRAYIPKPDGRLRPLGIAALEDKILQRAVVEVLNAIYEEDFLGYSYGFRPGRSPHNALDALATGILTKKVNFVLDADVSDFFSKLDRAWLKKFLEHRIADRRILRLIDKWLSAGVIEDGNWSETPEGSPQGASASPLLANVYLHYVFDRWVRQWRKRHARGDMVVTRFADDFIVGFEHLGDAKQFLRDLRERFARFNLELHPDKTHLIEFGRYAAERRSARGLGKPETFDFLGFTHVCGKTRDGRFKLLRVTVRKRLRAKLKQVKAELLRRRHLPIPEQGRWLGAVVRGHLAYYAVPGNARAIKTFCSRGQPVLAKGAAPPQPAAPVDVGPNEPPHLSMAASRPHPASLPRSALCCQDPRQEPSAVVPHAGICAGGRPQGRSLPQSMAMHNDEMGDYEITNHVVAYEAGRHIAWEPVLSKASRPEDEADVGDRSHYVYTQSCRTGDDGRD